MTNEKKPTLREGEIGIVRGPADKFRDYAQVALATAAADAPAKAREALEKATKELAEAQARFDEAQRVVDALASLHAQPSSPADLEALDRSLNTDQKTTK